MKHPSEYTTALYGGIHVMEVDAGTVITDERTQTKITVDDETSAFKGNVMWCTARTVEKLKAAIPDVS